MVENLIEVFYHANLEGNWLFWLRTHSLLQGPETGKFSSYVLSVIRNETLLPTSSLRFEVGVFFFCFPFFATENIPKFFTSFDISSSKMNNRTGKIRSNRKQ
jgi:hypothetical protein